MRLAQFQAAFAAALYGDTTGCAPARHNGFRVYRNTVIKGCIDALLANFPTVERLTGTDWLRDVAALYARRHPPVQRSLLVYGEHLPEFLAGLEQAGDLPYLQGVAQLDLLWLAAHAAADEAVLSAGDVGSLSPLELGQLRLRPHASARWVWFDTMPAFTIWDCNRRGADVPAPLEWRGEGALLVRPADQVSWMPLDRPAWAFLQACAEGRTLADAAAASGAGDEIAARFAALLAAGAFAGVCIT